MSMFLGEKQETDTRQPSIPRRGTEEYLSPEERDFIQRYLSHPDDFPPAFKSWIIDHIAVNIPQIPFSQISGAPLSKAVELIESSTLTSASTFDIDNISDKFTSLELVLSGRGDTAANFVEARVRFNGDTGANYDSQLMFANSATVGGSGAAGTTYMLIGSVVAANGTSGRAGRMAAVIPHYRDGFHKGLFAQYMHFHGTTSATYFVGQTAGMWRNTAAITRIQVFPATGNFAAGTRLDLLGLRQPS